MAKLPVADFLRARIKEYDPTFEVRKGTGFDRLFFKPVQFITQPLVDIAVQLEVAQSIRQILALDNPDAFDEEKVDDLLSNVFVDRAVGNKSSGSARSFFAIPVAREWPANGARFVGSNGKVYTNPAPFAISAAAMSLQIQGGNYYYDIPVQSVDFG